MGVVGGGGACFLGLPQHDAARISRFSAALVRLVAGAIHLDESAVKHISELWGSWTLWLHSILAVAEKMESIIELDPNWVRLWSRPGRPYSLQYRARVKSLFNTSRELARFDLTRAHLDLPASALVDRRPSFFTRSLRAQVTTSDSPGGEGGVVGRPHGARTGLSRAELSQIRRV